MTPRQQPRGAASAGGRNGGRPHAAGRRRPAAAAVPTSGRPAATAPAAPPHPPRAPKKWQKTARDRAPHRAGLAAVTPVPPALPPAPRDGDAHAGRGDTHRAAGGAENRPQTARAGPLDGSREALPAPVAAAVGARRWPCGAGWGQRRRRPAGGRPRQCLPPPPPRAPQIPTKKPPRPGAQQPHTAPPGRRATPAPTPPPCSWPRTCGRRRAPRLAGCQRRCAPPSRPRKQREYTEQRTCRSSAATMGWPHCQPGPAPRAQRMRSGFCLISVESYFDR